MDPIYWRVAGFLVAGVLMVWSDGHGLGCYFSGVIMGAILATSDWSGYQKRFRL